MSPACSSKRTLALALIALFVFSSVPRAHAHLHHHQSPPRPIGIGYNPFTTAGDLDGDIRPDRLTLHANGYDKTITVSFGNARSSQVSFTASTDAPGDLITTDIDLDGDVDLVWFVTAVRQSAVVLINNGGGNFNEATDNSPYALELDGLFGSIDPSGNLKLKRRHKSSTLTSASFHEVGLPLITRFESVTAGPATVSIERLLPQSHFPGHIRKRGPPTVLS